MRENADQENAEYEHFSHGVYIPSQPFQIMSKDLCLNPFGEILILVLLIWFLEHLLFRNVLINMMSSPV